MGGLVDRSPESRRIRNFRGTDLQRLEPGMSLFKQTLLVVAGIAAYVGLMLWASTKGHHRALAAEAEQKSIEHTASVEPPMRIIPIEDGHVAECFTFPMRSYDNELFKCVACREDSMEPGPKHLSLSCVR